MSSDEALTPGEAGGAEPPVLPPGALDAIRSQEAVFSSAEYTGDPQNSPVMEPGGAAQSIPPAPPGVAGPQKRHTSHPPNPPLTVLAHLLTLIVFAMFILTFLAQPFRIPSESMEPTLLIGDFVLVDKVALAPAGHWSWLLPYGRPGRGEPVVFRYPVNPDEFLVKRIIGVPGDTIRLVHGRVERNGQLLPEAYALYLPAGDDPYRDTFPASDLLDLGVDPPWWIEMHRLVRDGVLRIPEGEYFVMGDNRNHSLDSRYWGLVPRADLAGKPALVYFSVRTPSPDENALDAATGGTMSKRFARWDRTFRLIQ